MASSQKEKQHLFLTFYEVLLFCEGLKSSYNIKIIFKSAKALEDTVTKLKSIKAVEDFQLKLDEFWNIKGLSPRKVEYFQNISCLVLQRFMRDNQFSDDHVREAVKEFLLMKTENEFLEFFKSQSIVQNSVEKYKQGFNLSDDSIKCKAFMCLEELKKHVLSCNGNIEKSTSQIENLIRDNDNHFKILLQVLCLPHECELEALVQNLAAVVVSRVLSNLDNVNCHCHTFNLNSDEISCIVHRWPNILHLLMKMMEFSIRNLQCVYEESGTSYSWKYLGAERGLTYDCITTFLIQIRQSLHVQHFQSLLDTLKSNCTVIVEDILRISRLN